MKVLVTGMPVFREKARSSWPAFPRTAPLPARIKGWRDFSIKSAAVFKDWWSGEGRRARTVDSGSWLISMPITSSGSSMWQAPGFSACAILKAFRTISGITEARSTREFHFVSGSKQ